MNLNNESTYPITLESDAIVPEPEEGTSPSVPADFFVS